MCADVRRGLESTFEKLASMNGSAKRKSTLWIVSMKLSDETVSGSTCMPARLLFKAMTVEKYLRTASLDSGLALTSELKIWKSEEWRDLRVLRRLAKEDSMSPLPLFSGSRK